MTMAEKEITVKLSSLPYNRLQELAEQTGKTPESLMREILERALVDQNAPPVQKSSPERLATKKILEATGRVRVLSPDLRKRIIPGVTLAEVRTALDKAGGPSLSQIVLEHRRMQ